jgi:hypothetical protein
MSENWGGGQMRGSDDIRWEKYKLNFYPANPVQDPANPVFSSDLFWIYSDLKFCDPVINELRWDCLMSSDEKK